jgi:hypothetical protein
MKGAKTVDSFVAVEKPHQTFRTYFQGGDATYRYGQKQWDRSDNRAGLELKTSWVNLADTIGYVTVDLSQNDGRLSSLSPSLPRRSPTKAGEGERVGLPSKVLLTKEGERGPFSLRRSGVQSALEVHGGLSQESPLMVLPKPGIRSALSLFHVTNPADSLTFITAIFPNQSHAQTKAMPAQVIGAYADGVMTCRAPGYFVWANFSDQEATVPLPADIQTGGLVKAPPNSAGILHRGKGSKSWARLD